MRHSSTSPLTGAEAPTPPENSLQLLVNRFSTRYDAGISKYAETVLLRVLSGGVQPIATQR